MNLPQLMNQTGQMYGRGPDNTLVHMSNKEVNSLRGLAQAAGGDLSINPHTGLPEAGFLDNILPAIAGIGLSLIPGVGPVAAGAITGGVTALTSGSLEKGLAAGLGAFGAAGLGSGLASAGANAAGGATQAASNLAGAGAGAAESVAQNALTPMADIGANVAQGVAAPMEMATAPMADLASQVANQGAAPMMGEMGGLGQLTPSPDMNLVSAAQQSAPEATGMLGSVSDNFSNMGRGLGQLFTDPSGTVDAMGGWGSVGTDAMMAMTPMMYNDLPEEGDEDFLDPDRGYIRPYTFHRNRIEDAGPGERKFDQYFEEHDPVRPEEYDGRKMYAAGGSIYGSPYAAALLGPLFNARGGFGGTGVGGPMQGLFSGLGGFLPKPEPKKIIEFSRTANDDGSGRRWKQEYTIRNMTEDDKKMGRTAYEPGLEYDAAGNPKRSDPYKNFFTQPLRQTNNDAPRHTGSEYARGGHLKGPGDGLSDNIPAVIDGVQPAALSTDEYVVPADVVSALGNGSSDAGARELDAMLERIRMSAHGKKSQQRKVSDKALPA